MALTTVTLADGTAAVVHTEGRGWSRVGSDAPGVRARLIQDVLHAVDVEGMLLGCDALRQARTAAADVVVEERGGGVPYAQMRVLCTATECRELAEHCENVDEPFIGAAAAREWALAQASDATPEAAR
ncbi:hypothetical protein ACH4FX_37445 [Streptomyces sp. NPDC018019]|uniref:hypothetical protein n=1 Tax=Streptomyces sp. NPDC018019 TaxID=3365030 RepID=UPI0037968AB6